MNGVTKVRVGERFANQILVLISAPLLARNVERGGNHPVRPLSVALEVEEIRRALENRESPLQFEIKIEFATVNGLRRVLASQTKPLIIHFIGHGVLDDGKVSLVLEDDAGMARMLSADDLRRLLQSFPKPPCRLALLNACHSEGLASFLIEAGVRHVIAVNAKDRVLDAAARCFAKHFYYLLLAALTVKSAFNSARISVLDDDTLRSIVDEMTFEPIRWNEELKFLLLPGNSSVHDDPLDIEYSDDKEQKVELITPLLTGTNIPIVSADPFVGRNTDLYEIAKWTTSTTPDSLRCLAIQGFGGMGKTVLAEAAGRWQHERNRWTHGVWFVPLRNVEQASQARERIASTLGMAELSEVHYRHVLLILDDLDKLIREDSDGIAQLLHELLGSPRLRLIVTSRENLPGGVHYQPLRVKRMRHGAHVVFRRYYAGPLPEWESEDFDILMDFLDGYPFAIRLAATYMKVQGCSLQELNQRLLESPFSTLEYHRGEEKREKSLAASLDVSYQVLPPAAQDVFPLLALFPAGLSKEAASAIIGSDAVIALETLQRFSMAEERVIGDQKRFALPEPARLYAERLQGGGEMHRYSPLALQYYSDFLEQTTGSLSVDDQRSRLILSTEQPNYNKFLDWGYDYEIRQDGVSYSARGTAALARYWKTLTKIDEDFVDASLDRALEAARRNADELGEAHVLRAIGSLQEDREEYDDAVRSYRRAKSIYEKLNELLLSVYVLELIGGVQEKKRELEQAINTYEMVVSMYLSIDALQDAAATQAKVADIHIRCQRERVALESYTKAIELFDAIPNYNKAAELLCTIGVIHTEYKDKDYYAKALECYHRALERYEKAENEQRTKEVQEIIERLPGKSG